MRTLGGSFELERRRCLAVQRVLDGYSTQEVADFLGVDARSVRRWVASFEHDGIGGLVARPVPGRPPKLTNTQEKIVRRWLADSPLDFGFSTELWTCARLNQLIELEWGIAFNPDYLGVWLRQRGFSPQKPQRQAREHDEAAIARWLAVDWPRIKRKARRRCASVWFLDESGLLMAPLLRRSWSPRGHPPVSHEKAGHREKVSVAAALWLPPAWDRLSLAFQTLVNGYYNTEAVADFVEAAITGLSSAVIVVWDRGNMHRGEPMRDLVRAFAGRLEFESLPSHAPELMPVEQLWTWLKYSRLCNRAPLDAQELDFLVLKELEAIRYDQPHLKSFFQASKLPFPRTLLS